MSVAHMLSDDESAIQILIVDDELSFQKNSPKVFKLALNDVLGKEDGCKIKFKSVENFDGAVKCIEKNKNNIRIILSDHDMDPTGEKSGSKLLRHLKVNDLIAADCLLIGYSARPENETEFMTAGADAFILKDGIKKGHILGALEKIVEKKLGVLYSKENSLKEFLKNIFREALSGPAPSPTDSASSSITPSPSPTVMTIPEGGLSPLQLPHTSMFFPRSSSLYSLTPLLSPPLTPALADTDTLIAPSPLLLSIASPHSKESSESTAQISSSDDGVDGLLSSEADSTNIIPRLA